MAYKVRYMWHPTHLVTDLAACENFFQDVFGLESIPVEVNLPPKEECPTYPRDYSILTLIREVMFDCVDPTKYVVEGRQSLEDVDAPGHPFCFGVAVEGADEIYKVCIDNGIRCTDQANRIARLKKPPVTGFKNATLFFTLPESAGLRYQIYPIEATGYPDPRTEPGWKLPPVSEKDPLALEFCSHHTILSSSPVKAFNFLIGILKGKIIHQGRNELLETDSTYISLGDDVYEIAVPVRAGSIAAKDVTWNAPFDTYHAITFRTADLAKVRQHLKAKNIPLLLQDEHTVVTDPKHTIGMPFGFTDRKLPGDLRLAP
jgi:catechol 2,3-dioxygenase-like lactoylglutathione lyase family enzyme